MKTFTRAAATMAALIVSASASPALADIAAGSPSGQYGSGHYEWRAWPSAGPRAPARAPARIWVRDGAPMAAAHDCAAMPTKRCRCPQG